MKKALILSLPFFFFLLLSVPSVDAKLLPQVKGTKPIAKTKSFAGKGISVYPKLRSDKKALNVSFGNLQNARSIQYNLIYRTEGHEEGAGGTITKQTGGTTRELLFGTCSSGVCRYHTNISNMRLEILTELNSGKKTLKRYRIKI